MCRCEDPTPLQSLHGQRLARASESAECIDVISAAGTAISEIGCSVSFLRVDIPSRQQRRMCPSLIEQQKECSSLNENKSLSAQPPEKRGQPASVSFPDASGRLSAPDVIHEHTTKSSPSGCIAIFDGPLPAAHGMRVVTSTLPRANSRRSDARTSTRSAPKSAAIAMPSPG